MESKKYGTNELINKTEIESQMQKINLRLPIEKQGEEGKDAFRDWDRHIHTTIYKVHSL